MELEFGGLVTSAIDKCRGRRGLLLLAIKHGVFRGLLMEGSMPEAQLSLLRSRRRLLDSVGRDDSCASVERRWYKYWWTYVELEVPA